MIKVIAESTLKLDYEIIGQELNTIWHVQMAKEPSTLVGEGLMQMKNHCKNIYPLPFQTSKISEPPY